MSSEKEVTRELSVDEMKSMLLAWQDWWNKTGSHWYLEGRFPQSEKPPFLISTSGFYGKCIADRRP